jgi:hypothetical protein
MKTLPEQTPAPTGETAGELVTTLDQYSEPQAEAGTTPAEPEAAGPTQPEEAAEAAAGTPAEEPPAAETPPEDDEHEPIAGLKPEVQAKVNRRIDKLTAKRKSAEERAAKAERELETLRASQARTDEAARAEIVALGVHPDYISADEAKVVGESRKLAGEMRVLFENLDGTQEYSAAQIRAKYFDLSQRHQQLAGRAQAILDRAADRQLAHMRAGRQMEQGGAQAPARAPAAVPPASRPVARTAVAPQAARTPPVSATRGRKGFDLKRVMEAPSADALEAAYVDVF